MPQTNIYDKIDTYTRLLLSDCLKNDNTEIYKSKEKYQYGIFNICKKQFICATGRELADIEEGLAILLIHGFIHGDNKEHKYTVTKKGIDYLENNSHLNSEIKVSDELLENAISSRNNQSIHIIRNVGETLFVAGDKEFDIKSFSIKEATYLAAIQLLIYQGLISDSKGDFTSFLITRSGYESIKQAPNVGI